MIPIIEILQRLEEPLTVHQVGAIIIAPTRELALQTFEVVTTFTSNLQLTKCMLIGGVSVEEGLKFGGLNLA